VPKGFHDQAKNNSSLPTTKTKGPFATAPYLSIADLPAPRRIGV
jgi:hypothetical protein